MAQQSAYLLGAERLIAMDRFPKRLQMAREHANAETIDYTAVDSRDSCPHANSWMTYCRSHRTRLRIALSLPETITRRRIFEANRPQNCALFDGLSWCGVGSVVGGGLSYSSLACPALKHG
jgi:hypothetical protein